MRSLLFHSKQARHQLHSPFNCSMPASQNNSYKDDRVTLPPIRDILRGMEVYRQE